MKPQANLFVLVRSVSSLSFITIILCVSSLFSIQEQSARNRTQAGNMDKKELTAHLKYLNAADEALMQKRYDSALTNYFKCLNYAPPQDKSMVWDDLGYVYLQSNEPERAKAYLESSIESTPNNYNPRFYLALTEILLDDFSAASAHIAAIHQNIHFDSAWIEAASGITLQRPGGEPIKQEDLEYLTEEKGVLIQGDKESSTEGPKTLYLDAFDERNIPVFFVLRGVVLNKEGRVSESLKSFGEAAALTSGRSDLSPLLEKLSTLLAGENSSGDHEELIKVLVGVPNRVFHSFYGHPTNLLWTTNKMFLEKLRQGKLQEAEEQLLLGLSIEGSSLEFNHNLALLAYDEEDMDKAIRYCARTVLFHPEDFGALDLMGNILYKKRDFDGAGDYFQRALEQQPDNPFSLYTSGACAYHLGEWADAENYWLRTVKLTENRPSSEQADSQEAFLSHEVTVRSRTIYFLTCKALGTLYFEQDSIREAVGFLRKALSLSPEDTDILFFLGKGLARQEDDVTAEAITEAISLLEKHIFLGGDHTEEAKSLLAILRKMIKRQAPGLDYYLFLSLYPQFSSPHNPTCSTSG